KDAILSNTDVRRVLADVEAECRAFPDRSNEWSWAMLRAAGSPAAADLGQRLLQDEAAAIGRSIAEKLAPVNATVAYRTYWAAQIAGKEGEGAEALKRCAARGVPLPIDGK